VNHFIFIDESNFILSKAMQKHSVTGGLKVLEFIKLCRGFMESIIMATNHPNDIVEAAHVNTATKIVMHLGDMNNINNAGKSSAFTLKQIEHIPKLRQGQGIAVKEGINPYPVNFSLFSLPIREVTDKEVEQRCAQKLSQYEIKIRKDEFGIEELEKLETCPKCGAGHLTLKEGKYGSFIGCDQYPKCNYTAQFKNKPPMFTSDEHKLLMDVALHPTATKTAHYKDIGFSMDKGNRITKKLLKYNLVRELAINLSGRQREAKILYLTDEGYKTINMQPDKQVSRGEGPEHSFWIKLLKNNLIENGINAVINHNLKGKEPDIAVIKQNGEIWAIEISITTNPAHELGQIRKDLKAGYDNVITFLKEPQKAQDLFSLVMDSREVDSEKVVVSQLIGDISNIIKQSLAEGGDENHD